MAIYDIVVPKDNMLRQFNEMVDFPFVLEELKDKYLNIRTAVTRYHPFVCLNIYY